MRTLIPILVLALALPFAAAAQEENDDDAAPLAGLLASGNRETLPDLTLASGVPLAQGPMRLKSGTYYVLTITADGSAELALTGPEFFRAVWINEIVINDIEIRPLGLDSFEFDDAGALEISFVAIKPGTYNLHIPGTTGETQRVDITIE